jgi:hypothetical protein
MLIFSLSTSLTVVQAGLKCLSAGREMFADKREVLIFSLSTSLKGRSKGRKMFLMGRKILISHLQPHFLALEATFTP